uniref:SGTA homodimerisation domain-containing protein n=1 Tax=Meloidogyne javanica TaxID=6303 RepID=A0A915LUB7_MELJA
MDSDKTTENSSSEQFDNKGRITNDERNLIVSFVQFLRHKVSANQCTEDQEAQIEVATQCLEGAFGVSDKNYAFQPSKPLIDIFKAAEGLPDGDDEFPTPTEAEIAQANKLKEEGNELVKQSKFDDAILKYNDAIKLNRDPVYFCNRAAAYCRLEQYDLAIQDCRTALALDPNYAKAYGRMGYKNNLSIAEEKLSKARETFANNPQDPLGGLGGFGALFNNPDLARSIGAMMQEPGVRNMMQNFDNKGRITNDERNLIVSFVQFLRQKVSANQCTEAQEARIEVATQCLEGAFGVSDKNYAFQPSKPLIDIFKAAEGLPDGIIYESSSRRGCLKRRRPKRRKPKKRVRWRDDEFPTPTAAEIVLANKLKEKGNKLVKQSKFDEAILKYNGAIKLNRDPVYFCNRAAAYLRLEQYDLAIQDCRTALTLEPNYAKAYGRMGVALFFQNRYDQAVEAYKKASELDSSFESYKNMLSIAEEKLAKTRETFANNPQDPLSGLGGFGALFNDPDLARSIGAMMQEPGVRNMMQNMQNMFRGCAAGGGDGNQPGGGGGNPMADMLRAGEAMASVFNQANPQLVEMLRRLFRGGGDGNNENGGGGNNNSNGGGQRPH